MQNVFRFSDGFEDVFVEDNHYLYACNEPFDYAHMRACNEYHADKTDADPMKWTLTRYDTSGADLAYLRTLQHAPADVARAVIMGETLRALSFCTDMDADEREAYIEHTLDRLNDETASLC